MNNDLMNMINNYVNDFVKIYKITDLSTGNCYIGSTKQKIADRVARHRQYMRTGEYCSSCKVLENDNYIYEQIAGCHKDNRKETERYYINNTPNCINDRRLNFNKKDWSSEKIKCECGCEVSRGYLSRHKKTKIHNHLMSYTQDNES
jgi:hypothetical protein